MLRWYDQHKRDLPWRRRSHNAYAQWVAEVMLQQTRVDTVIGPYKRFIRRFPNVKSLARASCEETVKLWEGLGYYRRIEHLHRAARELGDLRRGVPDSADQLAKLPGIGPYTAAAIASIAWGERVAAVDGNVARVIARLFGLREDVLSTRGKSRVQRIADQLISANRPGDFNQAWMDLGSMLCTPKSPDCPRCPLTRTCVARTTGQTASLPLRAGQKKPTDITVAVGVFLRGKKMLVRRRPPGGLWSGLWEFPNFELNGNAAPARAIHDLADDAHLALCHRLKQTATVKHQLTHRSLTFRVYVAAVRHNARSRSETGRRWVTHGGFAKLAVSTAHRRVARAVQTFQSTGRQPGDRLNR